PEWRRSSTTRCRPANERADSARPGAVSTECCQDSVSRKYRLKLARVGLCFGGRIRFDRAVAEVVVVEKRLRYHLLAVRRLEVLGVQRIGVGAQHLISAQVWRIADNID